MKNKLFIILSILGIVLFPGCSGQNNSGVSISVLHEFETTINNAVSNVHENIVLPFINQENIRNLSTQLQVARENYALYEDYMKQINDFRENRIGETHYADYDRYCYYDLYSFPQGYSVFFSEGEDCIGIRMALRCEEQYDENQEVKENSYYCEYYEIDDMQYISFSQTNYDSADVFQIPNFMCMKDMEAIQLSGLGEEYWTTFTLNGSGIPDRIEEIIISDSVNSPQREFLKLSNGTVYKIDHEAKALYKLPEEISLTENVNIGLATEASSAKVYASWLKNQCILCENALIDSSISLDDAIALIPGGYKILSDNDYTVADMNNDGILDILFTIYPELDSYEDMSLYEEWSPYNKINEYYYLELWMLWGQNDGSYREECIKDSVVWDETYSHTYNIGFPGGFIMEYFVGRAPFETVLRKYTYNMSTGKFELSKVYQNDSYHEGFAIYTPLVFGVVSSLEEQNDNDRTYHVVTVEDYVNTYYNYLLCESGYSEYGAILSLQDKEITEQINNSLEFEIDRIFAAIEELDECHDVLLQEYGAVFLNSKIAVFEFKVQDKTINDVSVIRRIPITIDLSNGEVIDYLDYISTEELALLWVDNSECETDISIIDKQEMFNSYNDYNTLLASSTNSLTIRICREGLLIYNTTKYWPDYYLIPRSKLIDSPLAAFWDDWP